MTYETNADSASKAAASLGPVFGKGAVAIMLATDNNYAPYASVMIQSIKDNASKERSYDIVVVGSLSDKNKKLLELMAEKNIVIRVVNINPFLAGMDLSLFTITYHFTIETYYRFFIPRLFQQYEKVLYLDVDMVALRDVAELFDTDMGSNWWAVTREQVISFWESTPDAFVADEFIPYIKKMLKMDSVLDYFQAGVMIWNVKQCIKDKVYEQLIDRLKEIRSPIYVDQCVMNSLANGRYIHWLSGNWNVAWNVPRHWIGATGSEAHKTAMRYFGNPFIIHFAGNIKPWNELHHLDADKFWQYARKTPFYETVLFRDLFRGAMKVNQEIENYERKAKKYRILKVLTFDVIKLFSRRENLYRDKIRRLKEMDQ